MKRTFITLLLAGTGTMLWAQQTDSSGQTSNSQQNSGMNNANNAWNNTRQSTGAYNAYGAASVPYNVQRSFSQEVTSGTDAQWESNSDLWRVTYTDNGKKMSRYYGTNGQSFIIALPIMASFVPDNVMAKVQELYGDKVYDVTMMRSATHTGDMMNTMANAAMGSTADSGSSTAMNNSGNATMNSNASSSNNMSNNGTTTTNSGNTTMNNSMGMNSGATSAPVDPTVGAHYHVRIIENGTVRSEMINEDGSAYVAPTPTDSLGMNTQSTQQWNNQQSGNQQMNNSTQQQWNNNSQQSGNNTGMDSSHNNMRDSSMNNNSGNQLDTTTSGNGTSGGNLNSTQSNASGTTTLDNTTSGSNTTTSGTTGTTTDSTGTTGTTDSTGTISTQSGTTGSSTGTTTTDSTNTKKTNKKGNH